MNSPSKKLVREGQLTLLSLSSQCTVVTAGSLGVSDYILQMFCLPINQRVGHANPWRAVCMSTANLASVPRTKQR